MRRLLLAFATILVSGPAMAVTSDTFQITDANGTILMDVNGVPAAGSLLETDEPTGGFGRLDFEMNGTISATVSTLISAGLQEPGAVGILGVSDAVFIVQQPQNHLSVEFVSDTESTLNICDAAVGGPAVCMSENGQMQDLTSLLFPMGGAPFHVKIQSDITEVPEPSTAPLLAAGLGCVSLARRRLRVT